MRKLGVVFVLLVCMFVGACTSLKPGCLIQNQGSQLVSSVLVAQLQCVNAPQVQADVLAEFEKLNLCPNNAKQGPLANAICPAVTQFAVQFLAQQVVPASWQCSSSNLQMGLQAALLAACQKLPMAPKH